jgi:trehalose 6-phosphate phosphatase
MSAMQKSAKLECETDGIADGTADGGVANTRTHWIPPPAGGKRAARSPRYLFRAWSEIKSQIRSAELCALLLDFDGTLVRIQRRPWEVRVPQRIKGLLERLTLNPKLFVAIVSGRRYQDLRTRIGIENLRYIGLHGAEEDGNSICIGTDVGKILSTAKLEAQKQIASMRGIRIEDKGLSFAVHYREATSAVADAARSCLLQLVLPLHQSLKVFEGAMVWEVLPHEIQGKGAAARALMNRLPLGTPAIYIGDDGTDESAFRSLSDQITVRVGNAKGTQAKYYLRSPRHVMDFLVRLEKEFLEVRPATKA